MAKKIELRNLDIKIEQNHDNHDDKHEVEPEKQEEKTLKVAGYIDTNEPSKILGNPKSKQWREVITSGTFSNAIQNAAFEGNDIDLLVDHDGKKILSSTKNNSLDLKEDAVGLYFEADVSQTSWGKDLVTLVKDGIINSLSFGMHVIKEKWSKSSDGVPLRTISEIELFEISALKTAAYSATYLETRGLEVIEVEVPEIKIEEKEKELRFIGGGQIGDDEITPLKFYEGLYEIAAKLDLVVNKLDEIGTRNALDGLQDAKIVLAQTQALVDSTTGSISAPGINPATTADPNVLTDPSGTPTDAPTVEQGQEGTAAPTIGPDGKPVAKDDGTQTPADPNAPKDAPGDKKVDENGNVIEEKAEDKNTEAPVKDGETPVDGEAKPTEPKAPVDGEEAKPAEPEVDADGNPIDPKKKQAEVRSFLNEHKIMEVPEEYGK